MAKLIETEEAMAMLRKIPNHYLWNKNISRWTEEDVQNLKVGKNINHGNIMRAKYKTKGQPIKVITPEGKEFYCDSVIEASKKTEIKPNAIYNVVNGRYSPTNNYQFIKTEF